MGKVNLKSRFFVTTDNSLILAISSFVVSSTIISLLYSPLTYADNDSVVDQINVTIPISCTLDGTGMDSHTANIMNRDYETEIGSTTLTAYCNDNNGFSIYAIGYSNDTYGTTDLIGVNTEELIPTGTTLDGSVSNWAMKLSTTTDPTPDYPITIENNFNNYHAVPSTYTLVASRDSSTDIGTSAIGSVLTTTYAASVSASQVADTYVGKVRYTLVHPANETPLQPQTATSGCINYFPNGSNVVGTMGCQSISASDTSATLLAGNFSREGYGFAGWSDVFDYDTNPNAHFYGPQEDITFTAGQYTGSNNGLALYAVWVKSAGSLQDTSKVSQLCGTGSGSLTTAPTNGTANLSSVSALTDQRDNQTYAIAKLADGKCWMIENLRLESTNSDNSIGALAQSYGTSSTYGNFSGLADAESANFAGSSITANSLYYSGTQSGEATINIGTGGAPSYRFPRYNNINTASRASSPTSNSFANNSTTGGMYSYGNYYTWSAAIADLTYYDENNNDSATGTSLCPSGWHLPTGGKSFASNSTSGVNVTGDVGTFREFYNLGYKTMDEVKTAREDTSNSGNSYYSSNTTNTSGNTATKAFRAFPNNFLYSGYFEVKSATDRGNLGRYWSSAVYNYGGSYGLGLGSSYVLPGTQFYERYNGFSIRCTVSAGS